MGGQVWRSVKLCWAIERFLDIGKEGGGVGWPMLHLRVFRRFRTMDVGDGLGTAWDKQHGSVIMVVSTTTSLGKDWIGVGWVM